MKPTGPIPPEFATPGPLVIGGQSAEDWAAAGTPVFVYDTAIVRARVQRLRAALPDSVDIHYAIKANPLAPFLRIVSELVDGLDVASAGELDMALAVKPASAISFAGPGKRDAELEAAIRVGATLNLESEGEGDRAFTIADRIGVTPRLAVRVNPSFELKGSGMKMGGRASPFGIDAERVPAFVQHLVSAGANWQGFHIFAGSQSLDTAAIIETQAATLRLARQLADASGHEPPLVNLGGGLGIPYFAGDTPVDVEAIGAALQPHLEPGWRHAIELGRWFAGECGVYLTRIIDRKESNGETFLVCDGGLHHQLAASGNFGTVVRRNYPLALARDVGGEAGETVNVVGPLCTPLDRLGDRVGLPHAERGDVIALFCAGAYGRSASPIDFLGHPHPREVVVPHT